MTSSCWLINRRIQPVWRRCSLSIAEGNRSLETVRLEDDVYFDREIELGVFLLQDAEGVEVRNEE